MARPSKALRAFPHALIAMIAVALSVGIVTTSTSAFAQTPTMQLGQPVTVPSLPYPKSGLRQRLIAAGKAIPSVDESLQAGIPAVYFEPAAGNENAKPPYPAVVALPDCDNHFPETWITILRQSGYAVLFFDLTTSRPSDAGLLRWRGTSNAKTRSVLLGFRCHQRASLPCRGKIHCA